MDIETKTESSQGRFTFHKRLQTQFGQSKVNE